LLSQLFYKVKYTNMNDNLATEQSINRYLAENNIDAAVSTLYQLIVVYAKQKNFSRAESLLEKLFDINPMALKEIIGSEEIIEQEKQKSMPINHQEMWSDLYRSIGKDEGARLFFLMKEATYSLEQPLFVQGDDNSNLYFVNQGQLKIICKYNGREVLLKQLNAGDILGMDTFFCNSVCTTTAFPLSRVKVNYLEKRVLRDWKEKNLDLELKLYRYCLKFENTRDLLLKKGLDRRVHKRYRVEGKASIQILSASGDFVGKPFRGVIFDISTSGLACIIKLVKKEIGQLLLGRNMELKLSMTVNGINRMIYQVGTVVAVSSQMFEDYILHLKFHKMLDNILIREIATSRKGQIV
jgi:CRP-like cAMP-binding protein